MTKQGEKCNMSGMNQIELAIKAAGTAGNIHMKYFQKEFRKEAKSVPFDLVTVADLEAEKEIVSIIRGAYPDHNILAEENVYNKTASEYTWIIDPLDGTNNFASGLPIFCVSIALARNDEILLGAIYDATRGELFTAEKGSGAYLNERRISVTKIDRLEDALLVTGFYYDRGEDMIENLERIKRFLVGGILGVRRLGAAALDLAYVASGRASGFWEFILSPWDFAAGKVIVEEAGGKVTGRHGEPIGIRTKPFVVASNSRIHDQILAVLNS